MSTKGTLKLLTLSKASYNNLIQSKTLDSSCVKALRKVAVERPNMNKKLLVKPHLPPPPSKERMRKRRRTPSPRKLRKAQLKKYKLIAQPVD